MTNGDPNLNTQEMSTETSPHWSITGSANCLPIGTRLAEFEITGVVGEGGFGNVYLAFDHSLQRTVAIKEYMPVALASRGVDNAVLVQTKRHRETFETGMNSFINEARLLAQFDHPALIKVYRFWEQNKTAYMAMRYYEGETFKSIIAKHPEKVTEAWLKPILRPLLEALETLYKLQILHRDISPDNIMIQNNGDAVLLDFGAARQILGDMTQALTVILKPGFAPVEQYAEDSDMKQGAWTDIYALSAVMYLAITKTPPPTSVTRLLKDPIELLQAAPRAGFSKEFLAAIDAGMMVKPQDRPQTVAEFRKLLGVDNVASMRSPGQKRSSDPAAKPAADVQKGRVPSGAKTAAAAKPAAQPKKSDSNKGSWALVAAGVLLAAIYGTYQFSRHKEEPKPEIDANVPVQVASTPAASIPSINPGESGNATSASATTSASKTASASAASTAKSSAPVVAVTPAPVASAASASASASHPAVSAPAASAPGAEQKPVTTTAPAGTSDPAAANTDPQAVDSTSALYKMNIKPWANVFVDGVSKGVTPPLKRLVLPEGKHTIKLVNPNFPDHSVEVTVNAKKRYGVIDYDFTAH